ncbi:MAG TPA: hypothetical protein VGO62_14745 [Myxococcota bacterium]
MTAIQPRALNPGRGAEPLKLGTLQAHGGVGGGYSQNGGVAGDIGGGIEGQVAPDLAIGWDAMTGYEGAPGGTVTYIVPTSSYLTFQYNPSGFTNLAVRGAGGIGVDALGLKTAIVEGTHSTNSSTSPWGAVQVGVVTSANLGPVEGWLDFDIGVKKFVGGTDNKIIALTGGSDVTSTSYSGGVTGGVRVPLSDSFAVFGAANVTGLVLLDDASGNPALQPQPNFVPNADVQVGITYAFPLPN